MYFKVIMHFVLLQRDRRVDGYLLSYRFQLTQRSANTLYALRPSVSVYMTICILTVLLFLFYYRYNMCTSKNYCEAVRSLILSFNNSKTIQLRTSFQRGCTNVFFSGLCSLLLGTLIVASCPSVRPSICPSVRPSSAYLPNGVW